MPDIEEKILPQIQNTVLVSADNQQINLENIKKIKQGSYDIYSSALALQQLGSRVRVATVELKAEDNSHINPDRPVAITYSPTDDRQTLHSFDNILGFRTFHTIIFDTCAHPSLSIRGHISHRHRLLPPHLGNNSLVIRVTAATRTPQVRIT